MQLPAGALQKVHLAELTPHIDSLSAAQPFSSSFMTTCFFLAKGSRRATAEEVTSATGSSSALVELTTARRLRDLSVPLGMSTSVCVCARSVVSCCGVVCVCARSVVSCCGAVLWFYTYYVRTFYPFIADNHRPHGTHAHRSRSKDEAHLYGREVPVKR